MADAFISEIVRIPLDIRQTLTDEQATRLAALLPRQRRHGIAWRVSTRLFGRRFYLAVLTGREGRSPGRVTADGHAMSFLRMVARIIAFALWISLAFLVAALAGIVLLYLVKSQLGIDLMDGPSILHDFFF